MSEASFQYTGDSKQAMAGGVLFPQKEAVVIDNGQLANMLRERKDFKEIEKPNVTLKNEPPKEEKQDTKARSPKNDAKQS